MDNYALAPSPRAGDATPDAVVVLGIGGFLDWLMDRVVVCPSGCWLWAGALSGERGRGSGYPKARIDGVTTYVHRLCYEKIHGSIPEGFQVDHLCSHWSAYPWINRRCVNPDHLEAVPHVVNQLRKPSFSLQRKKQREVLRALQTAADEDRHLCDRKVVLFEHVPVPLLDPASGLD